MRYLAIITAAIALTCGGFTKGAAANHGSNNYYQVRAAVCHYFTGYLCGEAMAVVACETGRTYSVWAKNGQYENIFQMGTRERQMYGWHTVGSSAWSAARAARNYYNYARRVYGYGWHPWSCRP